MRDAFFLPSRAISSSEQPSSCASSTGIARRPSGYFDRRTQTFSLPFFLSRPCLALPVAAAIYTATAGRGGGMEGGGRRRWLHPSRYQLITARIKEFIDIVASRHVDARGGGAKTQPGEPKGAVPEPLRVSRKARSLCIGAPVLAPGKRVAMRFHYFCTQRAVQLRWLHRSYEEKDIYIYMCVCVCVCVCREREKEKASSDKSISTALFAIARRIAWL